MKRSARSDLSLAPARALRLLLVAVAFCMLAGCSEAGTSSSAPASSRAEASLPSSQVASPSNTLPAPSVDSSENGILLAQDTLTAPDEVFDGLLTWGPGTAGCTLHSVICASEVLDWATQNQLAALEAEDISAALAAWYDGLDAYDQETLAETWPMVRDDAGELLADPDGMADLLETAGLTVEDVLGANADDFLALCEAADPLFVL
jgi:hypothetical protein